MPVVAEMAPCQAGLLQLKAAASVHVTHAYIVAGGVNHATTTSMSSAIEGNSLYLRFHPH